MELDYKYLDKELDKIKAKIFLGDKPEFFGSLLCSLNFSWNTNIPTAQTDGVELEWNPEFFLQLKPEVRKTVLVHELQHVARLHSIRTGSKNLSRWNKATDIRINNNLEDEGYSFEGIEDCWKDHSYDINGILVEEEIYNLLEDVPENEGSWGEDTGNDLVPNKKGQQEVVNAVSKAVQQAKKKGTGNVPGEVEELLNKLLEPVVPWETVLMQYFTDLGEDEFTWSRPNKRYQDMYLPSRKPEEERLEHLIYYLDTSGSISQEELNRFNSELKYIHETLQPKKISVVQFDTQIHKIEEFTPEDNFDFLKIVGRGGTSLEPVRQHIIDNQPTAAIVFSDLCCQPMKILPVNVPIIWLIVGGIVTSVPFGKYIKVST